MSSADSFERRSLLFRRCSRRGMPSDEAFERRKGEGRTSGRRGTSLEGDLARLVLPFGSRDEEGMKHEGRGTRRRALFESGEDLVGRREIGGTRRPDRTLSAQPGNVETALEGWCALRFPCITAVSLGRRFETVRQSEAAANWRREAVVKTFEPNGGSAWESNPPPTPQPAPDNGFEDWLIPCLPSCIYLPLRGLAACSGKASCPCVTPVSLPHLQSIEEPRNRARGHYLKAAHRSLHHIAIDIPSLAIVLGELGAT